MFINRRILFIVLALMLAAPGLSRASITFVQATSKFAVYPAAAVSSSAFAAPRVGRAEARKP